jgi:hypothetical protein
VGKDMPSILKGKNTIPTKFKIGFWATFTSTILDKLLELLQMKGVVLPPTLLDVAIYILIILLGFGLWMMVWGIIEWVRKTHQQKQTIELLRQERIETIKPDLLGKLVSDGRLENISQGDVDLILLMSIEVESRHGYNDLTGLLADRANGVPLNELKARPCSQCGIPRNQRGKHRE